MDSEIGAVGAKLLGRNRELDRLQQRVRRRPRLRLRRRGPMAEGEKSDVFHGRNQVRFEAGLFTPFWSCGSLLLAGPFQVMRVKTDSGLAAALANGARRQEYVDKSAEGPDRPDNGASEQCKQRGVGRAKKQSIQ